MSWPKVVTAYLHGDKEQMGELADELGLRGENRNLFRCALHELVVTLSVNENGTYKIVGVSE